MSSRILTAILCGALIAFQASAFDEGIDYATLPDPQPTDTGDKVEVLEIFMYSCPHCFHLEPTLEKWLETIPENAEFRRMPAVFGQRVVPHARAFYAAEVMGVEDQFHEPLFRALHAKKRAIWTEDELVAFAGEQGIDEEEFRKAYNSFFVVKVKVPSAQKMVSRYGVDGVPAIIVNGKYRTSPSMTGSRDKMIQVVDHLIELESGTGDGASGGS